MILFIKSILTTKMKNPLIKSLFLVVFLLSSVQNSYGEDNNIIFYIDSMGFESTQFIAQRFTNTKNETDKRKESLIIDIEQDVINKKLNKVYSNFLNKAYFEQLIPTNGYLILSNKKGLKVANIDIAEFENNKGSYKTFKNNVLIYINYNSIQYKEIATQVIVNDSLSNTSTLPTNRANIYVFATYMYDIKGRIDTYEKSRNNSNSYSIESMVKARLKLVIYKYDSIDKKFHFYKDIKTPLLSISKPRDINSFQTYNILRSQDLTRASNISLYKSIGNSLSYLQSKIQKKGTFKSDTIENIDNKHTFAKVNNGKNTNTKTTQLNNDTPNEMNDATDVLTEYSPSNINGHKFDIITNIDDLKIDQPLHIYTPDGKFNSLAFVTSKDENIQSKVIYGYINDDDTIKTPSHNGSELSFFTQISPLDLSYTHTDVPSSVYLVGLSYKSNLGFKFDSSWLSHTYLSISGKYGVPKPETTKLFPPLNAKFQPDHINDIYGASKTLDNYILSFGLEKRFYSSFRLYLSVGADISADVLNLGYTNFKKENINALLSTLIAKPSLKIGYLFTPSFTIEIGAGMNFILSNLPKLDTNPQATQNFQRSFGKYGNNIDYYLGFNKVF